MAEPRIRARRFATEPGEVRMGTVDDLGRFRPFTEAEARERGIRLSDYDLDTGRIGTP